MSKYSKLPKAVELAEEEPAERINMPISKLCCLPILLDGKRDYKDKLNSLMSLEELMPRVQRMEIYQMVYMDKLLTRLKEYKPDMKDKKETADITDVISRIDPKGTYKPLVALMTYKSGGDMSKLIENLSPNNPMLSMMLPMLAGGGKNPLSSLLPMLAGNMDLSALFGGM